MHDSPSHQSAKDQRIRLLDTTVQPTEDLDYPMTQYNYVVRSYNSTLDGGKGELGLMSESGFYRSVWRTLKSPCMTLFVLLLVPTPGLGLLIYVWLFTGIMMYFSGMSVFKKNVRKVPDAFQDMVLCPELCTDNQIPNKHYELRASELNDLSLNKEIADGLAKTQNAEGRVRFMVYSGRFWDFYHNYPKYKTRHILTLITGTLLLAGQGAIVFLLYKKFLKK